MRDAPSSGRTSALGWILCATAAGFILQNLFSWVLSTGYPLEEIGGLTIAGLRAGHVWALFTYGFLHSQTDLLQILFIGLSVYFLGRELLPLMGSRRFAGFYGAALATGGVVWAAVNWRTNGARMEDGLLIGAAPAVTGLLALFALLFPNREITIFFLFIPVTMKPKYVAIAVLVLDLFGCFFCEILGAKSWGFAYSAHLGGMAAGWIYFQLFHGSGLKLRRSAPIELPTWIKHKPSAAAPVTYHVNVGTRENLRAEVDRILDKINSQGFGALTADEKRLLDEARDLLSRR